MNISMSMISDVIAGIECCLDREMNANCNCKICPYNFLGIHCMGFLYRDVLEILNEVRDSEENRSPCASCQEFVCDGCEYAREKGL